MDKKDKSRSGFVSQYDYQSRLEVLPISKYKNKLICPCGRSRYYSAADAFQVEKVGLCKPCLRLERLKRRKERQKDKILRSQSKALEKVLGELL